MPAQWSSSSSFQSPGASVLLTNCISSLLADERINESDGAGLAGSSHCLPTSPASSLEL